MYDNVFTEDFTVSLCILGTLDQALFGLVLLI